MKTTVAIILMILALPVFAAPRINIVIDDDVEELADIRIIITEEPGQMLDLQTLVIQYDEQDVMSSPLISSMITNLLEDSVLDITFPNLRIPNVGVLKVFVRNQEGESGTAEWQFRPSPQGKKIGWSKIWNTAKQMARKLTPNAIVKEYLESKGYICPPGPWILCARSAE